MSEGLYFQWSKLLSLPMALKTMRGFERPPSKMARFSPAIEMRDEVYSSGKSVTPSGCCFYIYLFHFQYNFVRFCPRTNEKGDEAMEVIEAFKESFLADTALLADGNNLKTIPKIECQKVGKTVLGISCPVILHFIKVCP